MSVGADYISARPHRRVRSTLAERTDRRGAEKPPLGDQGEVAGRRPDGGEQNQLGLKAYNPSVTLRVTAPFAQGSLPSQALGLTAFGEGVSGAAVRCGRI